VQAAAEAAKKAKLATMSEAQRTALEQKEQESAKHEKDVSIHLKHLAKVGKIERKGSMLQAMKAKRKGRKASVSK
tara:strand:+ start:32 stop:256 length:225 start_codon:yes stop_codon:yes gene_type:complete